MPDEIPVGATNYFVKVGENTDLAVSSATSAAVSAAVAEAVVGPNYANTTAGLTATTSGQSFAVDNGDGTVSIYRNVSGSAVLQRSIGTTAYNDGRFTQKTDLASTASGKGAALVGYEGGGTLQDIAEGNIPFSHDTTYTAGTLGSKAQQTVCVTDAPFNAMGDGVANDTAAIQAAIDAMSVLGGGTVILSAGSYTTSTLNLPQDVFLEGQGKYATRLVATSGLNAPLINRAGTSGSVINRGGVSGLAIIGSGKSNTGMIGIKNVYTNRGVFRDIDIFGTYRGMWIENVWQDSLTNIHVHGGGSDQNYQGFYMAPKAATVGVSNAVIATGCMAQGVENVGFRIENGNGSKFTACEASDGVHAWYIGDPSSGTETAEFMHFVNCLGDTTSGHIWRLEKGSATALRRMHFANCWAGNSTGGTGLYVAGASEIPFVGWQIVSTQLHGIHFNQSSRCLVSGCNVRDYNRPDGASNGVHIEDSSIIKVVGCDIYTTTPGTAKGFVEVGTSNNNCLIGSNSRDGWTILGGATTQANNTTA
jgi:hypothetical protein